MAAPPNYNPTYSLIPSTGGTIRAMSGGGVGVPPDNYDASRIMIPNVNSSSVNMKGYSGGGDGGAPPHYNPHSLLPAAHLGTSIKTYEGGGLNDPAVIAVSAVATKVANNATTPVPIDASATIPEKVSNTQTEVSSKKQISLNGHKLTIGPPWDLKGAKETEALAWFGVDKASDDELKKDVLQALYDGVCDTDKPLIMVLECEPIRRLVQSLAEKLLGNLTRPVVKKTPTSIAAQELQSAKMMSFNVFKNLCKTTTAKEYIDSSDADIVCTQKDTKIELANYTEIKACGADDDTERVYLKKGLSSASAVECITANEFSAVLFTYQGVTIVNMGSNNEKLLEEVLKKEPHIILGSIDGLLEKGYIRAEPINKDLITADAIWYKKDQDVFELKDTIIPNILVKTDQYTDPVSCSYSDHNPITTVVHFKKTIKKLSLNADQAAAAAAKAAREASVVGSLAMEALEGEQGAKTKSIGIEASDGAQGIQSESDGEEEDVMDTLEQRISFFEAEPTEIERTRIEKIMTKDGSDQSLKDQRNAYGSFFTRTTPSSAHTQYKTKDTRKMLEFVKAHLYDLTNGVIERLPNHYNQFKKDLTRANHLTFVSDTFRRTGNEGITQEDYNQIFPIIEKLPNPLGQIVSCFNEFMTETPIRIGMNENDPTLVKISEYPTLFMILPDKIVFHKVSVYKQILTMNQSNHMTPSQFATEFTIEIDRATLNGSIQIDKYDIKSYVKEFEEAHAKNFEIVYTNAANHVLLAMLKRMEERLKNNRNDPIVDKLLSASIILNKDMKPTQNNISNSVIKNVNKSGDIILDTTQEIISILETDNARKATKLAEIQSIYKEKSRIKLFTQFVKRYIVELKDKQVDILSKNEQWYSTSKISLPDVIRTLDASSYEQSIQDAIATLKEQPDLHKYIYEQFMIELEKRKVYYDTDYRTKRASNENENKSLSVRLSDDKLSELLERLKESRSANTASMLPSVTGYLKRRAILGKIGERTQFHEAVQRQTISVSHTNAACAKASEYYMLFQNLVNEIGAYLSNKKLVEYAPKEIVVSQCDILDSDRIAPAIQSVKEAVAKLENGIEMSPIELKEIEVEVKAAVKEVEEYAADLIFDDELAKKIAVAAVSVIMNDFVKPSTTLLTQESDLNMSIKQKQQQQEHQQQPQTQQQQQQQLVPSQRTTLTKSVIANKKLLKNPIVHPITASIVSPSTNATLNKDLEKKNNLTREYMEQKKNIEKQIRHQKAVINGINLLLGSPNMHTNQERLSNAKNKLEEAKKKMQSLEITLQNTFKKYTEEYNIPNRSQHVSPPVGYSTPYVHTTTPPPTTVHSLIRSTPSQTHPKTPLFSPPPPPPASLRVLQNVKNITTNTVRNLTKKNHTKNKSINLTKNFETRNALTAELKQKKIKGLNQQLRNEGVNFRGSPAKNNASNPVVNPVVNPVASSTSKQNNSLNILVGTHKSYRPITNKPVSIIQNYSTNNDNFKSRIDTLLSDIERTENDAGASLNSKEYTGPTIGYINRQLEILKKYKPMIKQLKVNIKSAPYIPSLSSDITEYERICNDAIRIIRENLTLTSNISASELEDFSNGGKRKQNKRRTQKKRKQTKQKKRFRTQKK